MATQTESPITGDAAITTTTTIESLPDELIGNILFQCTTPTLIQLIQARKEPFFRVASSNRHLLLHHLAQLPGDKDAIADPAIQNDKLFLLLRQRAVNSLYGINFTANMTEHLNRSTDLNLAGCSIAGLDADYVRMALCFKGTNDIRQYTSNCNIKEKIKQPVGGQLLKLRQHGRIVSCLYQFWNDIEDEDLVYGAGYESDSDSESEADTDVLGFNPFPPSANAQLTEFCRHTKTPKVGATVTVKMAKPEPNWCFYRITHFDVYTIEDSVSYSIKPITGYVPRDFVVQSTQHCAILWDEDTEDGRPTEHAKVVNYRSTADPNPFETLPYEEMVIWPKQKDTPKRDSDSDSDEPPERLPERIAFFKEGRRLKLYEAGGVVPYEVLSTSSQRQDPFAYASTNRISFGSFVAHVDTPFYGNHATYYDDANQEKYCFLTWLCLGIVSVDVGGDEDDDQKVLCVLRAQTRMYPDDCDHRVSFSRMAHIGAGNATVVARLWGWEEMHTNLTGAETVSVSPCGTRIAIAMWNKVYIYALNPRILCQEVVVESDDEDRTKSKKKKKRKFETPWETKASGYYQRKRDRNMMNWQIAELRPVVLDLEGAVAHKMSWSPTKGRIDDLWPGWRSEKNQKATREDETGEDEADIGGEASSSTSEEPSEITVINTNSSGENSEATQAAPEVETDTQLSAEPAAEPQTDGPAVESFATDTNTAQSSQDESPKDVPVVDTAETSEQIPQASNTQDTPPSIAEKPTIASGVVETAQDIPTPLSPQTLTSNFSSMSPAQLNPLSSPEQTSKALPRKEKGVETKHENTKPQSLYSLSPSKVMLHQPAIVPMKESSKSKKTDALILESSSTTSLVSNDTPTASTSMSTNQPATSSKDEGSESVGDKLQKDNPITVAATPKAETVKEENKSEDAESVATSSKEPVDTEVVTSEEATVAAKDDQERKEEKIQPRKRITEDELVILTDRGIQIWSLGAAAKGQRKKLALPMEESLCGRLPFRKGKSKEILDDEMMKECEQWDGHFGGA